MLPLSLLKFCHNNPITVELKSGEQFQGTLSDSDKLMNLILTDVVQTSSDGKTFIKLPEIFIKGINVKSMQMDNKIVDEGRELERQKREERIQRASNRDRDRRFDSNERGGHRGGHHQRGSHRGGRGGFRGRGGRGGGYNDGGDSNSRHYNRNEQRQ
ncbi:hypothetical protein CANCADRAFT_56115 [Tortispora caseinolytica NRRL Y-17796]|uniref:LSM complex subunit LSM4 n=1 Tax=Tortispora caseinolytica NRRL Y-17796 TaxID=767744 RepID=A0A1E4TL22_9ASCO|nr:hypothetical protein CANCADRAFT_56115 [Tortispora caseinolytica NRRL Y-17796]